MSEVFQEPSAQPTVNDQAVIAAQQPIAVDEITDRTILVNIQTLVIGLVQASNAFNPTKNEFILMHQAALEGLLEGLADYLNNDLDEDVDERIEQHSASLYERYVELRNVQE
jgi:hypothetical protein